MRVLSVSSQLNPRKTTLVYSLQASWVGSAILHSATASESLAGVPLSVLQLPICLRAVSALVTIDTNGSGRGLERLAIAVKGRYRVADRLGEIELRRGR